MGVCGLSLSVLVPHIGWDCSTGAPTLPGPNLPPIEGVRLHKTNSNTVNAKSGPDQPPSSPIGVPMTTPWQPLPKPHWQLTSGIPVRGSLTYESRLPQTFF